jgi:hypothetical protein
MSTCEDVCPEWEAPRTGDPELARIAGTLGEIPFPKKFAVEICAECNFRCAMCHHPGMRRPKGKMPFALWTRCADQIAAVAPHTECWFSFCGEPLLEPDLLLRVLAYGRAVGLRSLNINTNGMLLTRDLAGPLLESGAHLIVFGLDGFTAPTYERIRRGGIRDVVYGNIEHLLALRAARGGGPEIQVQFIEMDDNAGELPAFSEHWLARGATLKVRKQLSWGGTFTTPLCVPAEERIACPWALTMMHVFWDGRVPRCPGDTEGEEGVGNAWDEALGVLWQRLGTYRGYHLNHQFDRLPERCQRCADWMVGAARRIRPDARVAR